MSTEPSLADSILELATGNLPCVCVCVFCGGGGSGGGCCCLFVVLFLLFLFPFFSLRISLTTK